MAIGYVQADDTIKEYKQLVQLYELQRAYIARKKINCSFVFLKYSDNFSMTYDVFFTKIQQQLRNSDFVFEHTEKQYVVILLTISKVIEAKSFLKRLEKALFDGEGILTACITEIASSHYELAEVLEKSYNALLKTDMTVNEWVVLSDFLTKKKEVVKVSILENDTVIASIFKNMIQDIKFEGLELQIEIFSDGLQCIKSDWYRSGHDHIVILNDILPKKNGLEVLNYLRALPNEQKYLIYFISNRMSEDAHLNALENGADAYFVRPFNLLVFETQLKNYLRRLI